MRKQATILLFLRENPLFQSFSKDTLSQITKQSEQATYAAQHTIFNEGDVSDALYIILSGTVNISTVNEEGKKITLAHLTSGNYFGEIALFKPNCLRNADAVVNSDCQLLKITAKTFQSLILQQTSTATALRQEGNERIRDRLLKQSVVFQTLLADQEHNDLITEHHCIKDDVIFREGDKSDRFYLILEGSVHVYQSKKGNNVLVAHLGTGNYFGEHALIEGGARRATLIAKNDVKLASLSGEHFLKYYHDSSKIRQYMQSLSGFYDLQIKGGGVITLHNTTFMDKPSLKAVYHFQSGVKVTSTKVIGENIFTMMRANPSSTPELNYQKDRINRQLLLSNSRIVGITAIGNWLDLGRVHQHIIQQYRIYPWQRALFRTKGELWLAPEASDSKANTIVCHCTGVTRGTLQKSVSEGASSVNELAKCTGASLVCGSCAPILAEIVGRSDMEDAELLGIIPLTEEIKSFRFRPNQSPVKAYFPGQHIRIEAHIDNHWVQRSYTLTSPANQRDYYEITVKHEPQGLFSSWLHEHLNEYSNVRISEPRGHFHVDSKTETPLVVFGGGIGITPALSIVRSIKNPLRTLHIEYSSTNVEQFIYQDEFKTANKLNNVSVNLRATRQQGRLNQNDMQIIVDVNKQADYFICGPKPYEIATRKLLTQANVTKNKIHIEQFNSQTHPKKATWQQHTFLLSCSLLVSLLCLFLLITPPILPVKSTQIFTLEWLWRDFFWQQLTGYFIVGLSLIGMLMSLHKRIRRVSFLTYDVWRFLHLGTGLLCVALLALHTGLAMGINYNFLLMLCFLSLSLLGGLNGLFLFLEKIYPTSLIHPIKRYLTYGHIVIAGCLPVLLGIHIFSVYYFN